MNQSVAPSSGSCQPEAATDQPPGGCLPAPPSPHSAHSPRGLSQGLPNTDDPGDACVILFALREIPKLSSLSSLNLVFLHNTK